MSRAALENKRLGCFEFQKFVSLLVLAALAILFVRAPQGSIPKVTIDSLFVFIAILDLIKTFPLGAIQIISTALLIEDSFLCFFGLSPQTRHPLLLADYRTNQAYPERPFSSLQIKL